MHPIRTYFCQMAAVLCLILNTFVFLPAQQATSKAHTGWLRAYALSANNRYLVTAGSDGQLGVWDYLSGRPLIFFPAHAKVIADVAISTDEQFVFSVDESGEIKKWQILTGKPILSFQGHKGSNVTKQRIPFFTEQDEHTESSTRNQIEFPEPGVLTPRLATHKNGYLLSGGQDALLKLWDANTGKLLWSNAGHTAPILALGFSPDGKYCLSYAQDEVLKVWNTLDGKLLNTVELAETPNHPLSFSESDQQLILADTRSVSSWSLPELKKTTLFTLPKSLWALAGGSPGNQLWYAPTQDSIALYQIEQKKTIKKIKIGAFHTGLSVDKQGRILFMDAVEKQVKVYDPLKMGIVQVFGVLKSNIQDFKFGPNGKYLLLNDGEENVTVMDWGNPKGIQLKHFPLEHPSRNHFYYLDDQNQRLLTSSSRGDIKIWNIQTGQSQSFDNEQIRAALNVVWIKGGQNFAAWDFENGAIIYTGKDWLRVPMFSKSADEAAIKAGNYIFQSPITPYYHAAKDFFIPRTEREQQKKYGIYKHVGSVDAIYNRDSSRTVFVSKGSLLGTYNFETDKLKREDTPVQYAAWVGNQTNMLFVVEDNGAYVKDVEHDLKVLQYALPKAALYQICPSGAHFLLLTPEQNLEIREIMSGKLLATLSWKKGDAAAQVSFNPAAGNSSLTQWAQLQPLLSKPQGAIIQQKLDQLNPHSRKKTTGVVALLPKFGMPAGSISDLVFTKDGKALVGAGYSTLTVWDLPTGRVKYIIEDEFCEEIEKMLSTDDPNIVHIHFKKQGPYSSRIKEALNTTYWALNVETGKINKLPKKADEPIPTNQLNSKSQDLTEKPGFIGKDLNKWVEFRIAISPLKTYLAFAYKDFFELWDNQNQQLIYKRVSPKKVNDLLFDETEKRLVISTDDRIQIIDLSADKVALELDPFEGSLYGAAVLESGDVLFRSGSFTSSFNLPAAKMSSQAGKPVVSSWFNGHEHTIYDDTGEVFYTGITESNARPQVSKNKKYLVYIDSKGEMVVWDNQTRQAKHHIKTNDRYEGASFDERDSLIVAHTKKNIELYQVSSGKKILNIPLSKNLRSHFPFHFSANSRYLAYLDADYHPVIWDLKTLQSSIFPFWANSIIGLSDASNKIVVFEGDNVAVYPIRGNVNQLHSNKFKWTFSQGSSHYFPGIEKIVIASDRKIQVIDAKTGNKLMNIYPSSTNDWVAISDDGLHFETSENGLQQMAYLSTTGHIVPFTKKDTAFYREGMVKSAFKSLSYTPKVAKFPERTVNTRNELDYLKWFWEVNKPIVRAPVPSTQQPQRSLKTPKNIQFLDKDHLIYQNLEGQVQLVEPGTFRVIKTLEGLQDPLSSQVSKNQLYWVFTEDKSQIRLWSIPEMRSLKTLKLEDVKVSTLLITPDNKTLLAGCSDGRIRFYNLPDLQEKQAISIGKFPITALAHGNSGPQILVVDDSKRAYLYKLEKDQLHLQNMMEIGGNSSVISAQFNADDTYALVNIDQYDELKVLNLKMRVPVFETSRMLMGRPDICFFDPVDPYILHFSNTLEFSKIDIRTSKKVDSLGSFESIHSYNPFEQQIFIQYYDNSSAVFDLRSWAVIGKVAGRTPPQILHFGDQLKKIYFPDPDKNGVFHEYDWSKNSITATLDQAAYQEKSKTNSNKPYSLVLKKDSVQIIDNQTGKMLKQLLWPRPMPKNMNISKSGRYLAYPLESSSTTELFDLQLNKVVLTLPFAANSYFFSLNEQYFFANNTNDRHMQVIELSNLQTKDRLYQGFSDGIQVIPSVEYKNTKVLFFHDKLFYQFINTKTGQSLGSFYFLFSAEGKPAWAFIAPDGRFDGSEEALRQFYYVDQKNLRTEPVDFKSDPKYQAGLLQKLLE